MSINKAESEIANEQTTKDFEYRQHPAQIRIGAGHPGYPWVVFRKGEGVFGDGRKIIAEGFADTHQIAMARIRALIDGEHTRAALDDGPPF